MNKNDYIEKLTYEIEEKDKEINRLQRELDMILYSRTWRYRNKIKKAINVVKKTGNFVDKAKQGHRGKTGEYPNVEKFIQITSNYQDNIDFSSYKTDIKPIVFYLPQFHEFKENNEWWGKGFTEWTNTRKALPRFEGHYQPREPHDDIGYYDLSDVKVLEHQAKLAKQHGIYGFCFYYYWFSGKRLMEKVVDQLLEHKEIDLPFCLCWANENWTRTWDGLEKSVLIGQEYSKKDPKKFIKDIKKYIDDERYIKIGGKPVIMLYNPTAVPNVDDVIAEWKKEAINIGIGEIYVITRNLILEPQLNLKNNDAEYDFVPLQKGFESAKLKHSDEGYTFDYSKTVEEMINLYKNHNPSKKFYYTSMMAWDNSARRKNGYNVFTRYSLESFYNWNRAIINKTRDNFNEDERYIFINAWNEWCEGTYLESDKKYGYANINTLSKALFGIPFKTVEVINDGKVNKNFKKKIAVQVHLFHTDLIDEIIDELNNIPYSFDCYISTDNEDKKKKIEDAFKAKSNAKKVVVDVCENRGRDVAPFFYQMNKVYEDYDYICHIHSKKSSTTKYGDSWRKYTYENLFGSKENVAKILDIFESDKEVGLIYPHNYPVVSEQTLYFGENFENCLREYKRIGVPENYLYEKLEFAAGTMFWARVEAIKPIFETQHTYNDFPEEAGQIDGTLAHAIERTFVNLAKSRGYHYVNTFNNTKKVKEDKKKRILIYTDAKSEFTDDDVIYINELKKYTEKNILITPKDTSNLDKVESLFDEILYKDYIFEVECWKDELSELKELTKYDEVIITNNNCLFTYIPLSNVLRNIEDGTVKIINYHTKSIRLDDDFDYINTDFIVLTNKVINNKEFTENMKYIKKCEYVSEKLAKYNKGICDILNNLNIPIIPYIEESVYINEYSQIERLDQCYPFFMLLFKSPIINKKSNMYISDEEKLKIKDFIEKCKKNY